MFVEESGEREGGEAAGGEGDVGVDDAAVLVIPRGSAGVEGRPVQPEEHRAWGRGGEGGGGGGALLVNKNKPCIFCITDHSKPKLCHL